MSQERLAYLYIKDTIDQLGEQDRDKINVIAQDIRERIADCKDHGTFAVALVAAELNAGVIK
jgi:hypothetical protein